MKIKLLLFFVILLTLCGCGKTLDDEIRELVSAKNLWVSEVRSYEYEFTKSYKCNCVRDGLTEVIKVSDPPVTFQSPLALEDELLQAGSIKSYFEFIFEVIKQRENGENIDITVEYDTNLGFPSVIDINTSNMDGRVTIEISDLVVKK